jgi:pyruvate formate lyase activating enzyme
MISRREFLMTLAKLAPVLGGAGILLSDPFRTLFCSDAGRAFALDQRDELVMLAPKARYWTSAALGSESCLKCHSPEDGIEGKQHIHEGQVVKCLLCAQGCVIRAGGRGKCRARMNVGGELRSLVYGRPISIHVDPIEKKPFYHYLPGSTAYSLATSGCPLRCKFCQNWEISQASPEDYRVERASPSRIALSAAARKAPVIAFTYNEPTVFAEYMIDIAREARKHHLRSVLISCGFMNEAPLADLCRVLHAIKVDLKGFSESFYRDVCGAELRPVLRSIKQISKSRVHLEIVNLVVPTLNDSDFMLQGLVDWILGEVGPDVPVHFTRFHPDYQLLNLPPTPVATLERARDMAVSRGLHYVYVGNVPDHPGNHTYCPSCGKIVIRRTAFFIQEAKVKDGRCPYCRKKIAGVWA